MTKYGTAMGQNAFPPAFYLQNWSFKVIQGHVRIHGVPRSLPPNHISAGRAPPSATWTNWLMYRHRGSCRKTGIRRVGWSDEAGGCSGSLRRVQFVPEPLGTTPTARWFACTRLIDSNRRSALYSKSWSSRNSWSRLALSGINTTHTALRSFSQPSISTSQTN